MSYLGSSYNYDMKKIIGSILLLFSASIGLNAQTNAVTLLDGGGSTLGTYNSITLAYGAIMAPLTQAYFIEIESNYDGSQETFPISFGALAGASSVNTITLRPAIGVSAALIQATMSGSRIIELNDADYVNIDGRPGGVGNTGALTIRNNGTTSSSNTIHLINGATYNTVRYCTIENATTTSAGRGVALSTSASNITGNSNNLFEYCLFNSGRYQFNSSGTAANLNSNNTVRACSFENPIFASIWGQAGTGNLAIDSCSIYSNMASGSGLFFGILFDAQRDTTTISNNRITNLQNGGSGAMRAIHVRSTTTGVPNLSRVYNNFIAFDAGNTTQINLAGIEYSGTNPTYGRIENNSIYVGGTLSSGGTAGNTGSAGIIVGTTNAASIIDVRNNLVVNERSGGTAGLNHVAVAYTQTGITLNLEYNTYISTTGTPAVYGATVYNDVATYVGAVSPNEGNTNESTVQFVSTTDLHLTGGSIGDPSLYGVSVAGITTDIDGDTRVTPYRGADEVYANICMGTPAAGISTISMGTICPGEAITVYTDSLDEMGITYQWQSSLDGITFSDIIGAVDTMYTESPAVTTYYQCIVTCSFSGMSSTSNMLGVTVLPLPLGGTISATASGYDYDFSVTGLPAGTFQYAWDFGDAGTSTLAAPSHTYGVSGSYSVTLIVFNQCDADTLVYTVSITVGLDDLSSESLLVYPNPATDLLYITSDSPVEVWMLDLTGREILYAGSATAHTISVKDLAPGTYYIKTMQNKHYQTSTIVVE
ncbi:MAG: hypothetical protein A3D92_21360 [Bacteroidetes bacterium RIFCSPHIGHO2_02_FULL_44_7]|nr:MAG: hypothetical protein A3D92_21360 [Bacteroidetes bacterium RIFCSPHIGHO2_02_FULL_44_7]